MSIQVSNVNNTHSHRGTQETVLLKKRGGKKHDAVLREASWQWSIFSFFPIQLKSAHTWLGKETRCSSLALTHFHCSSFDSNNRGIRLFYFDSVGPCVPVLLKILVLGFTHIHTQIYIYMYIYEGTVRERGKRHFLWFKLSALSRSVRWLSALSMVEEAICYLYHCLLFAMRLG